MTFQELSTGDYFRIPGMSTGYVYRKASDSHCSLHGMLQPIRAYTRVKRLTSAEVHEFFAIQQAYREKLKKPA
ncbi:hypothetical protein H6G41_32900 [Tolypothrix sp. FACHB-123]|uniref:hypothetical protein n=1 Tax=Tolypothrix sp. FACHB-123 TaxID=2692868 RepID=UPI001688B7A8|nr:hypothetical protein [Tolypothrix sp. FACHB-123]MBD2359328.1 hypothetical protein [Tolypothrix sp. FACHB-123]